MTSLAMQEMTDDVRIGGAIRERREALGMSQKDLALAAGLPAAQSVSEIEKGDRTVKAVELVRIARSLHVDLSALLGAQAIPSSPRVLWRRGSPAQDKVREAQLLERARRYAQLEAWCNEVPTCLLPDLPFNPRKATDRDVGHLAGQVARALDLGPIPALTIERRLEVDCGVKVFYEALSREQDGNGSAACVRSADFGAAILMNADEVPWRQVFSFAHELFHLVTWSAVQSGFGGTMTGEPPWYKRLEKMADVFASHVLMPAESVSERFDARVKDGKISYYSVARLAVEFGVSTHALLIRLEGLGRISKKDKQALLRDPSLNSIVAGFRPPHQKRVSPFPKRYEELARQAFEQLVVGKSMVARYLERNVAELTDLHLPPPDVSQAAVTVT